MPPGVEIVGRDGRRFENSDPAAIVAAFVANAAALPIDLEHATEHRAPKGEPAPAVGWIEEIEARDGGSIWGRVNWTDQGRELIASRAYRYLSPVLLLPKGGRKILAIDSAGLTNKHNLRLSALNQETPSEEEQPMKELLKRLGLDEGATEEAALNALAKLQGDLVTAKNRAETPSLDKFVPRGDYDAALNRAANAEQKLAETQKAEFVKAVNAEVDAAVTAGKITPATADFYKATCADQTGLDRFREFVKAAPEIGGKSGLEGKTPEQTGKALNAETAQVAKLFGLTPEDIEKYGR
ncbi:MAG: phage protease [Pigmentiphaga sp.]